MPIVRWGLTDQGRNRAELMCEQTWASRIVRIVSSGETKALETAATLAARLGIGIEVRDELHENDRSATGFVPSGRFEQLADAFFGEPDTSAEGWETARDAQQRVVANTADLVTADPSTNDYGDVVIVGHGAVGTLLLCHLLGVPISRAEDQNHPPAAPGGGNHWAYDLTRGSMLHRWRPIDELEPTPG